MNYSIQQELAYMVKTGLPPVTKLLKPSGYTLVWKQNNNVIANGSYAFCVSKRKGYIYPVGRYKKNNFLIKPIK